MFFYFTRRERKGLLLLFTLLFLASSLPHFYWIFCRDEPEDFSVFKGQIDAFYASKNRQLSKPRTDTLRPKELFVFDPNKASYQEFIKLGLSSKTAKAILKYRARGGGFYKKEDLQRIYTLRRDTYLRLEPFIRIKKKSKFKEILSREGKGYHTIEINRAEEKDWRQFKGIGKGFAQRILRYKKALGGFVRVDQIAEVYHFPDSLYRVIEPYLRVDSNSVVRLNINMASVDELRKHPYLDWGQAQSIVDYRIEKGSIIDIDILQIFPAFDDSLKTFQKIKPYLRVE